MREEEEAVVTEVVTRPPEGAHGVDIVQINLGQICLLIRNPHHNISLEVEEVVEADQEEGVARVELDQEEAAAEVEVDQGEGVAGEPNEVQRDGPSRM